MQQKLVFESKPLTVKTGQTTTSFLTFDSPDINELFPGFKSGDFAIIFGPQSVTSILSQLCVRAQISEGTGGLERKVVFIDAANSSSLKHIQQNSRLHSFDSRSATENIIVKRTYTAYRLTSLIMEELEEIVKISGTKVIIISDIVNPFLSDNVDDQEAKAAYSQIIGYLTKIARKHRIIIIGTYLTHENNRRNKTLQEITTTKTNILIRFSKTPYTSEIELEKHPSYMLGVNEYSDNKRITDYNCTISKSSSSFLCIRELKK